ncbi:unnamed protein product [Rhizophagus irregularis]|nr:unnamed protein product [Rhizophagus irregularis]
MIVQPIDIRPSIDGIMDINNKFKITTINVSGLNTTLKQEQILNYMKINKISCLIVTETKLQTASAKMIYKNNKDITTWWSCDDDNHFSTGVRILMNNDYAKYVIKKDIIEGRALKLTLLLKGKIRFTIIAIYNFLNNSYKDDILEFYQKLEEIVIAEKKLQAKIVCVGDFNASYDIAMAQQKANRKIFWKDRIFQIFKKNVMVDINLIYHDKPLNTWNRSDKKSRIDYIWITEDLVPDTIYASINKVHIFETDHSAVTVYFQIDDLFHTKQLFKKKKHNNNNLKVDYKKIDSQLWETYAEKIEKLLDKEKDIIDNVEISINCINRIWNTIRDTFKKANNELPKKKGNPNKEVLPKTIVFYKRFLHKLSHILMNLTGKKVKSLNLTNYRELVEKNSVKQLISDEELIENELIEHFRSFAGKKLNLNEELKGRWIRQYSPKQDIDESWYNEVIQPISESEWDHMIRQLANDKAPEISQISNEMLKHMGTSMKNGMLKLANLCLQVDR